MSLVKRYSAKTNGHLIEVAVGLLIYETITDRTYHDGLDCFLVDCLQDTNWLRATDYPKRDIVGFEKEVFGDTQQRKLLGARL